MNNILVDSDFDKSITKYNFFNMFYLKYFSLFLVEKVINLFLCCFNKNSKNNLNVINKSKKHVTFNKTTIFKTKNNKHIISYNKNKFIYTNIRKYPSYRVEKLEDRKDLSNDEPLYF